MILVVAKGDARLDNKKLKETFGAKARMLSSDEVVTLTGHPVGGVCPFGLENPLSVYCDITLKTIRGSVTRSGRHPQCGAYIARQNGGTDRSKMGGCVHLNDAPEALWRII